MKSHTTLPLAVSQCLECAVHTAHSMQRPHQPVAATSVYRIFFSSQNLEQRRVDRKSKYVTAARCIICIGQWIQWQLINALSHVSGGFCQQINYIVLFTVQYFTYISIIIIIIIYFLKRNIHNVLENALQYEYNTLYKIK